MENELYVATLRVTLSAEDEVAANIILDGLRSSMLDQLDPDEDGDSVTITQIIPFAQRNGITTQEICDVLRRDRNILIRTRNAALWDIARSIDETIYRLDASMDELAGYDYGHFMDVAQRVLKGENPVD